MKLKFRNEVSMGEMLTSISILISLVGVSINWYQDRQIVIKKQSTQMKELSIKAFSNVLSWKDLNLHFYDRAEILIEEVAQSFASKKDKILARDIFWKGVTAIKNELDYEILQKDLKTFHFILLSNGLDYDSTFLITITYVNKILELNHKDYLQETQKAILTEDIKNSLQTAILGNRLRAINDHYRNKTREIFKAESKKLESYLHSVIVATDKEIVYPQKKPK